MQSTIEMKWEFAELPRCIFCGGASLTTIHDTARRGIPLKFKRCDSCGYIFQNPRFTPEAAERYFASSTFINDASTSNEALTEQMGYFDYFEWDDCYARTAEWRLDRIEKVAGHSGRLLEIGSSTGAFLDKARRRGFDVQGLDISTTFAEHASKTHNLHIDVGAIETMKLPHEHFDVICCFGGISCWQDLKKGLANVAQALKPGGVFVINHPDYYSLLRRLQGESYSEINHGSLSLLHRASMAAGLRDAGLTVITQRTEWQLASLGRIVTYLKLGWARRLMQKLGLMKIVVPVLAVGTIFAVARKPR